MSPPVQQALETVYATFGDVPKPVRVEGCFCCIDQEELDTLLAKPLRSLSPDELSKYGSSALLTVGTSEDYVYFLPRILEILIIESHWWPSEEVVARTIYDAGFSGWPDARRRAITDYLDAVIDDLLTRKGTGFDLMDGWICALGSLQVDLSPVLGRVEANGARLVEFYEWNSQPLQRGGLSNGFWDNAPAGRVQVVDWFQSARVQELIAKQYGLV